MLVDVYNHVYVNKVFMVVCVDEFDEALGHNSSFLVANNKTATKAHKLRELARISFWVKSIDMVNTSNRSTTRVFLRELNIVIGCIEILHVEHVQYLDCRHRHCRTT